MANAPTDQLFLTALPNGPLDPSDPKAGQLRLSLLITPSLVTTPLAAPFINWPDFAKSLNFSATFTDTTGKVLSGPTLLTLDPNSVSPARDKSLWTEIFDGTTDVRKRGGHRKLHRSWRVSHDITSMSDRHQLNRLAHVYSQSSANRNVATPTLTTLKQKTTAPELFLHADFNTGTQTDLTLRIDDRNTADDDLKKITAGLTTSATPNQNYQAIVARRLKYGTDRLEKWGGARLSAAAVSALYLSCVGSASALPVTDPTLLAATATVNGWFQIGATEFKVSYPEFQDIPQYLDLLLFHRRYMPAMIPADKIVPPDFHQLLGMVHNYPAIMRQLHLVYDFTVANPGIDGSNVVSIALSPAQTTLSGVGVSKPVTVVSCKTRYTLKATQFFATPNPTTKPEDALIQNGLLNLRAPGKKYGRRFNLVPENADGQALKNTSQSNNQARGKRYTTSAPTSYNASTVQDETPGSTVPTPSASANPVTAPTAPRTVGLALFDRERLDGLEQQAAKVPDTDSPPAAPTTDFFAEDLVLGYRVDVLYNQKFYSLCVRNSTYNIFVPRQTADEGHHVDTWTPSSAMEKSADEGFTSFGATQSPLTDNSSLDDPNTDSMTQVHQAMFTWTGWSLSVPAPAFSSMNKKKDTITPTPPPANNFLAIRPTYLLGPKPGAPADPTHLLPPLRFNTGYKIRCRIVDLAGNGPLPGLDPSNVLYDAFTAAPFTPFSRHEPIRAPQFLLRKPIERKTEPGTHIDHMVARDMNGRPMRMLVPPRESLRLAELSNLATEQLPQSAFANARLEKDGAFPSVASAKDQHWIGGKADNPNDNDGIFLHFDGEQPLDNRYYPDPLANFIRIQPFEVTDDPTKSIAHPPFWLTITEAGKAWPHRLPVRILLIPIKRNEPLLFTPKNATELKDQDFSFINDDDMHAIKIPTLTVHLPQAATVVLRISSAAVDDKGSDGMGGDSTKHPVHLTHMVASHGKQNDVFDSLLPKKQQSTTPSSPGAILVEAGKNVGAKLDPNVIINGSLDVQTPKRSMTLVHAVKKPLDPPFFDADGITATRLPGKPEAAVEGNLGAHWLSTAKITCYARWSDRVDDLTLTHERTPPQPHHEVAFAVTTKDLSVITGEPVLRQLDSIVHHFTDTRAHTVFYRLSGATSFREYYPEATEQPDKNLADYCNDSGESAPVIVVSSARPLAPSLVYLIPAFLWEDNYDHHTKTWCRHRTVLLRAYFQRPFLLSGDLETVAVVLVDPASATTPANQKYVSRWGADPTRPITAPIQQNELNDSNFPDPNPKNQIVAASLAEGGTARFKPCNIQYSEARQLWYCDIPIDIQSANSPFVRLALARWQSQSLNDGTTDCRASQIVMAEFMQVSADRWVSLQKTDGSHFSVTISGAFPANSTQNPFTVTLQKRWYPLTQDAGWREVSWPKDCKPNFKFHAPTDGSKVSNWSTVLCTPHSAYVAKYRLFLTESDVPGQNDRRPFSVFLELP
jgi:hypothetical protein